MAGIRVIHDTLRNGTLTVIHPTKRYKIPYTCPRCKVVHTHKAIHIWLGNDGAAIVSEEAYELLRQSGMPGLTFSNVVDNPPPQTIGMGEAASQAHREQIERESEPVTVSEYDGQLPRLYTILNRIFVPKGDKNG